MSRILFIRHAETDMAGTFCGHSDPELNPRGHAQLLTLLERLQNCPLDAVYTSDLRRASSTAQAIAAAVPIEYHVRPALREIHFGDWEGLTWQQVEQSQPQLAREWLAAFPALPAPQGEPLSAFEARVLNAVESIAADNTQRSVAVVTHAGVIRTVLRKLQGSSDEQAWQQTREYCCIVHHDTAALPFAPPVEAAR